MPVNSIVSFQLYVTLNRVDKTKAQEEYIICRKFIQIQMICSLSLELSMITIRTSQPSKPVNKRFGCLTEFRIFWIRKLGSIYFLIFLNTFIVYIRTCLSSGHIFWIRIYELEVFFPTIMSFVQYIWFFFLLLLFFLILLLLLLCVNLLRFDYIHTVYTLTVFSHIILHV